MRKTLFTVALTACALVATPSLADQPFAGEIRTFAFNYCPQGWLRANGAVVPIMRYQQLMSLLGTTYGGNGQTTLGLPNIVAKTSPPQAPTALTVCIAATGAQPQH